ncbi:MAG: DUF6597 domain-containing transcriptional factor [Bacteroidota bacterium]
MNYTEFRPSSEFKEIVKNYWRFEVTNEDNNGSPLQHEVLPHSEVSIVFIQQPYFQGIRLLGPHVKKFAKEIHPDSTYFGIRLLPWISFPPEVMDKHQIINLTAACPLVVTEHFQSINFDQSLAPEAFISRLEPCLKSLFTTITIGQNDLVKYICLELTRGKSVGAVVDDLPLSTRVIQKKFKQVVGMSMRKYHNVSRQRRLWTDFVKSNTSRALLLHEYGFFDQAHFINDFKKHMNRSHVSFERRLKEINISLT